MCHSLISKVVELVSRDKEVGQMTWMFGRRLDLSGKSVETLAYAWKSIAVPVHGYLDVQGGPRPHGTSSLHGLTKDPLNKICDQLGASVLLLSGREAWDTGHT